MKVALADMMAGVSRESHKHHDVVVIGAGMAGLACASRLFQNESFRKSKSLTVLEGRDRIGGRINSIHVNGSRLDTGANWIHGIGTDNKRNPLMEVLPHKRYRELSGSVLFQASHSKANREQNGLANTPTKEHQIVPSNIAGIMSSGLWETIGGLHEMAAEKSPQEAKATDMLKAITRTQAFDETYENLPEEYHHTFGSMLQFIENMEAGPLTGDSKESSGNPSPMSLLEFAINDFDGDQVFLQDGYLEVINEVAKDLMNAGLVKLKTVVQKIDWSSNPIRIHTNQGIHTTANLITTIPLGVLKEQKSVLFEPRLPIDKEQAVEKLGFGTLDKIFLVYKTPWWTEKPYATILEKGLVGAWSPLPDDSKEPDTMIGFTDELDGIEVHQDGSVASGQRALSIINFHSLTGFPVLSCFVSCATAVKVESMTDNEAGAIVQRAFTNWFGKGIPQPEAIHVTRWSQDLFSRGSYSHMMTDISEVAHREAFQQSVTNNQGAVLRFAGEHTSRNHFATVHGALLSGWREADSILTADSTLDLKLHIS